MDMLLKSKRIVKRFYCTFSRVSSIVSIVVEDELKDLKQKLDIVIASMYNRQSVKRK